MKKILSFTLILLIVFTLDSMSQTNSDDNHPNVHKVEIIELIQTTTYTYLFLEQEADSLWVAVPKMDAEIGDIYYYHGGMEMRDFKSKELDRTFESILFLGGLVHPDIVEGRVSSEPGKAETEKPEDELEEIDITPPEGGISISELLTNAKKYEGKKVIIKGKVIKYNSGIMKLNWIHMNDGSCKSGECDLTVTTNDETQAGEIIIIEGTITLNKDFGAGYFYSLIMEDAKITR